MRSLSRGTVFACFDHRVRAVPRSGDISRFVWHRLVDEQQLSPGKWGHPLLELRYWVFLDGVCCLGGNGGVCGVEKLSARVWSIRGRDIDN